MRVLCGFVLFAASALAQDPVIPTPYQMFTTDANTGLLIPCAGCTINTYAAGTNTPLAVYTDRTLGTANTNPVQTNSAGYVVNGNAPSTITGIWVGTSCYKFIAKNASGTTLWTQDYICDQSQILKALLATSAGAGMVGFSQSSTYSAGTVGKKLQQVISVIDAPFNAKCDGSTNDIAAFVAAKVAAGTNGGVFVPPGTCLWSGVGTELLLIDNNVSFFCEPGATIVIASSVGGSTDAVRLYGPSDGWFWNCPIVPQSGTPGRYGINLDATSSFNGERAIKNWKIEPHLSQLGSYGIVTTFPAFADGIFNGVISGGSVAGGINFEKAGDNIAIENVSISGPRANRVNQVSGAGNMRWVHNSIVTCAGSINFVYAFHPVVEDNIIEPAGGCAAPPNDALIDFDGTMAAPIFGAVTRDNLINGTPGTLTYMVRTNWTVEANIGNGDMYNLGAGTQYGVLATANAVATSVMDPTYPAAAEDHIMLDQSSSGSLCYTDRSSGIRKCGPFTQFTNVAGTANLLVQIKKIAGQTFDLFQVLDENSRALLLIAKNGFLAFPYDAAHSIVPGINVQDTGGTYRTVFLADTDTLNVGYQAAPATNGYLDLWANGARAGRIYSSGGFSIGQFSDPGAGGVSILQLKTSGAAGGKRVVCADTNGKLYVSSTSTDCSN